MTITKKVTRGVKISSGLVLLGLVAGTFLGKWLPSFDGGDGVIPVQGSNPAQNANDPRPPDSDSTTPPADVQDVLRITIKNRSYWIAAGPDSVPEEIALQRAVELAVATTGDENGVRVRVTRDDTARASAEEELEQALLDANIARESIVGLGPTPP